MRRTIVDNSARFIPQSEQSKEKDIKPNTIKNRSTPRKQNKNILQNNKKFLKNISAQGFATLSKKYFYLYIIIRLVQVYRL